MEAQAGVKTEHLLDQIHLNRSLNRKIIKIDMKGTLFSSKINRTQFIYLKNLLCEDLAFRIRSEIAAASKKYDHNFRCISKSVYNAISSLDTCYAGKHEKCEKNSLVCSSRNSYSFPYLPFTFKGQVKMTPSDIANIEQAVHDRLNEHILEHSRFSTTSQKAECVFSALKSCNPKHSVTYSRNAGNRDHSAIHIINNGPGVSLVKKLEAMRVPPNRSEKSSSLRALHQMQRRRNLDICRKQKSISARRRTARRRQLYALHKDLKGLSNYKSNPEHNYCKKETI